MAQHSPEMIASQDSQEETATQAAVAAIAAAVDA